MTNADCLVWISVEWTSENADNQKRWRTFEARMDIQNNKSIVFPSTELRFHRF